MMYQEVYFVSLGPGDPEQITLQSLKCLQEADVIYTPQALAPSGKRSSKAQEIMLSLGIKPEQISLYDLPMSKVREGAKAAYASVAERIVCQYRLEPTIRIVVVAEGDSGFYSSSAYIAEHLVDADIPIRQLAGVPAFIACNARLGGQLVQLEEQLLVIPAEATDEEWARAWCSPHTIVVMKGSLCTEKIHDAIRQYPHRQWAYFEFVGQEREFITCDCQEICARQFPYFSIIISKGRKS